MYKAQLYVENSIPHMGQIITGFLMLRNQGHDVEIIDNTSAPAGFFHGLPMIRAEYRGQKIVYDMGDGYNIAPCIQEALDNCDILFKRSFSAEKNEKLLHNYQGKMFPLGFNYHVTHRESPINEPLWKHLLKPLLGRTPDRFFVPEVFEGKVTDVSEKPRILFLARLWDDKNPELSDEENAENTYINNMRIQIIRQLRKTYADSFIGGLNDNALSRAWAPDLIVPAKFTERKRYLNLVHESDICIGSMGLFESIGWKTGEYVAAAKAIVNERLHFTVTGDFTEGKHYLAFDSVEGCLDAVERLVKNPQLCQSMKQANAEYYQQYLRPDMLVLNSLTLVDDLLDRV